MSLFLRCRVSSGMFSDEMSISGASADGTEFSLFVPEEFVECDQPITGGMLVTGWLAVEELARDGNLVLVRLPGQTFENGQTVTVCDSQLDYRPQREKV